MLPVLVGGAGAGRCIAKRAAIHHRLLTEVAAVAPGARRGRVHQSHRRRQIRSRDLGGGKEAQVLRGGREERAGREIASERDTHSNTSTYL